MTRGCCNPVVQNDRRRSDRSDLFSHGLVRSLVRMFTRSSTTHVPAEFDESPWRLECLAFDRGLAQKSSFGVVVVIAVQDLQEGTGTSASLASRCVRQFELRDILDCIALNCMRRSDKDTDNPLERPPSEKSTSSFYICLVVHTTLIHTQQRAQ